MAELNHCGQVAAHLESLLEYLLPDAIKFCDLTYLFSASSCPQLIQIIALVDLKLQLEAKENHASG